MKCLCIVTIIVTFPIYKSVNSDKVQLIWHLTRDHAASTWPGHWCSESLGRGNIKTEQLHSASACGMQATHAQMFHMCHVISAECGLVSSGKKSSLALASSWQAEEGNSGESEYFHFIVMSNSHWTALDWWVIPSVYTQTHECTGQVNWQMTSAGSR